MNDGPLIAVVDDDESVREALHELLREGCFAVRSFASAEEFLVARDIDEARCLVTDIDMPGMSGCDLQQELLRRGDDIPVIFISAHADDALQAQMLERGAVACLCKPFSDIVLLETIRAVLNNAAKGDRSDAGQ